MKNTSTHTKAPRWDLSTIYSSVQGKDYEAALKKLDKDCLALKKRFTDDKIRTSFVEWLKKTVDLRNSLSALYASLLSYANAAYTTDTTNTLYLNAVSVLQEKGLMLNEMHRTFRSILTEHSQELDGFYTSFPQAERYRFIFEEDIAFQKHRMSDDQESIADDLQRFGADAWSRLQEQILSCAVDSETGKTFNELRNEAHAPSRKVRKTAYEKFRLPLR